VNGSFTAGIPSAPLLFDSLDTEVPRPADRSPVIITARAITDCGAEGCPSTDISALADLADRVIGGTEKSEGDLIEELRVNEAIEAGAFEDGGSPAKILQILHLT